MSLYVTVVTNLYQIINFDPILDHGIFNCTSIYRRTRPNSDITANAYASYLGNALQRSTFSWSEAKTIGAYD